MIKSDFFCFNKLYAPIIFAVFVVFGLLLISIFCAEEITENKNGRATYDYSSVEFISFDWEEENVFYYTNQRDGIYIKGSLEKVDVDHYVLINQQYKHVIPQQTVCLPSEEISLQVQNQSKIFVKTRDVVELIDGFERYRE